METAKMRWYYRSSSYSSLIWKYMILDNELRSLFHVGHDCGFITIITVILTIVIFIYAIMSTKVFKSNKTLCQVLQNEAAEKLPRKRSILNVRPAYNCIHKHLQQTDVFQDKAKRTVSKFIIYFFKNKLEKTRQNRVLTSEIIIQI
ncbi:uncharacterized protein LOC130673432 [Microplitis mediator]|uniref:uncharacterized protein LOC130673432 n=1 Tax=Microplitis mediator TaxID=375433 RepID=UPI002552B18A|nr:uncharacterized protein LOC130673432 [Microplitis mediator]